MSKNRNLKYQFMNCIQKNFRESVDKHSLKQTGKKGTEIFSYSQRKNLIDVSSNFANYMKENHPEVKQVREITSQHVQEFLNSKTSCSQATLEQYKHQFNKLERLVNDTYKTSVNFHETTTPVSTKNGGGKIRTDMLTTDNYNKLMSNSINQNFKNALVLSQFFGLRACECSKLQYTDISEQGIKIVGLKGGRDRFVKCENEQQKRIIKDFLNKKGRVCSCQTGSLQQSFNREKKKNNISSASDFHASRKAFATNKYLEYRQQGYTVEQSLNKVSHALGHGDNRLDLLKEYICTSLV